MLFALVMSMGITAAFAENETQAVTGTITVNPNYKDQVYTLYQLFDAVTVAGREDGADGISYKLMSSKTDLKATVNGTEVDGAQWFTIDAQGNITIKDDTAKTALAGIGDNSTAAATRDAFIAWAKAYGVQKDTKTASSDNDANVKFENLPEGYYFLTTTTGSLISLDSIMPNMTVQDKNSPPSLNKEITGVGTDKKTETLGTGDNTTDPGEGANEKAIAQVGDPISYKLTIKAKKGAENYVVTDTLSAGLTAPASTAVTVACTDPAITSNDYTVTVTGQVIKVEFAKTYLDKITEEATITIEYTATLNNNAVIGEAGNPNTAKLEWGHDNTNNYTTDEAKVYTAQVEIYKVDGSSNPLPGAGFVVVKDGKYYKLDNGVVTWVEAVGSADVHSSGSDGKVPPFTGLANGSYTLVETVVPKGYNKLADTPFTIQNNDYTNLNLKLNEKVTNNSGTELPSTGGIGTTIFYVVGSILVVAAGVLLVTKKRMSREG